MTGFGKVYSEATFNNQWSKKSKRHFNRVEFERACSAGPTDILLLHESPFIVPTKRIIFATRPTIVVYRSPHPMPDYQEKDIWFMPVAKNEVKHLDDCGAFRTHKKG